MSEAQAVLNRSVLRPISFTIVQFGKHVYDFACNLSKLDSASLDHVKENCLPKTKKTEQTKRETTKNRKPLIAPSNKALRGVRVV
jgi:hypothetical protein